MNLRLSNSKNSGKVRRNKTIPYLHQCRQCGLLFEGSRKTAASSLVEFSWDNKFMVDKCDTCKNFGLYNVFS